MLLALLPHRTALFLTSLMHTTSHQKVPLSRFRDFQTSAFNKQDEKSTAKNIAEYIFCFSQFPLIGPLKNRRFRSPLIGALK